MTFSNKIRRAATARRYRQTLPRKRSCSFCFRLKMSNFLIIFFTSKIIAFNRNNKNEFNNYILEDSLGDFEIKGNKLYYYRKEITQKYKDISIPEVSTFIIEDGKLILTDNYLSKYEKNIVLK